jgi:hypothetical protein
VGLKYGIPFFLISFTKGEGILSESESIRYEIVKKNKTLGYIHIKRVKNEEITRFVISSEVNTKLLLNFKAFSKETYIYNKDTLVFSSMYRTLNDKVKVDQSIIYEKGKYYLKNNSKNKLLDIGVIKCNLVKLFFDEPVDINQVYCDKLQIHLSVVRMSVNTYKVVFPNRSYNVFHYENGKCRLIEVVGSLYKVRLVPKFQDL